MATRLLGTDSADPWLPPTVKSKAGMVRVDDDAGNFVAADVEGVLAEISDQMDVIVSTGGGLPAASDAETIAGAINNKAVTPAGLAYERADLDVRTYGAKGDGATDDTAAIQAAINAAAAGGGVVRFPRGVYVISAALDLLTKNGVRLQGASITATVIRQSNLALPVVKVRGSYIGVSGMQLRYVTASTTAGATALELQGLVSFCDFRDLYLWNCHTGIAYGGGLSPAGEFSNSWTNIRIGPFSASAIKVLATATQGTGSAWNNIYISNYQTGSGLAGACTDYPLYLQLHNGSFNQLNIEWCDVVTTAKDLVFFQQCSGVMISKMHVEGNKLPASRGFITTFNADTTVRIDGLDLYGNFAASGNVGIVRPGAGGHITLSNVIVNDNASIAANFYAILDSSVATGAVVTIDGLLDPDSHIDGYALNYVGSSFARGYKGATSGFFGAIPVVKPAVTGSRGANAALASLLAQLAALGLVTDSTTV